MMVKLGILESACAHVKLYTILYSKVSNSFGSSVGKSIQLDFERPGFEYLKLFCSCFVIT